MNVLIKTLLYKIENLESSHDDLNRIKFEIHILIHMFIETDHQYVIEKFNYRNSRIGGRLLSSSYNFKYLNQHEAQQLCNLDHFNKKGIKKFSLVRFFAFCFLTALNALQYCFNVVFLFYSFLVINVLQIRMR